MKQLHTEIEIDAPPAVVWDVLVDLKRHHEWNPFMVEVGGVAELGAKLRVTLRPPGGRSMTFKPAVTEVVTGRVFEWCGRLGVRGVFDGRHRFELHASGTGTRLTQGETFSGLLVSLFTRSLDNRTKAGFELMNAALKLRAEQAAVTV